MNERFLSLLCVFSIFAGAVISASERASYKIIVNASNPVSSVSREEVSKMFLKKKPKWQDGKAVQPVDLEADSDTRAEFSNAVHRKKASSIEALWQRRIFSGRGVPPPKMSSPAEVLLYIEQNSGAIGYVPTEIETGQNCKVLVVKP